MLCRRPVGSYFAVASSIATDTQRAVEEVRDALRACHPVVAFLFHGSRHNAEEMARLAPVAFPTAHVVGCSTMGELGPRGFTQGGVSAVVLCAPARVAVEWVSDLESFRFEWGITLVGKLTARLGIPPAELDPHRHVFVVLTDGLGGAEERLVAALADAAPGIPLVGGSAGDDLELCATWTWVDGQVGAGSASVVLIEPNVPFEVFAGHHFKGGERRVVVTGAAPERRLVFELNGWPAVQEYARIAGVTPEELLGPPWPRVMPVHFAFRLGDELYMRAVMRVEKDGLRLGGAVEEGMVLTIGCPGDLVEETRRHVAGVLERLPGEAAGLLLFNCGGRMLEAEQHDCVPELWSAMAQAPIGGFCTYGELYGPLQVNCTLAGIAFGEPAGGSHELTP